MKSLTQIYNDLNTNFNKKTDLKIAEGSVLDSFLLSTSEALKAAYDEIEKNKTPHIYTSLTGDKIDGLGLLVGCTRKNNESDENYLYRVLNWNTNNQACNETAIEIALMDMEYSSYAKHVPYTHGVGTATVYVIPKSLDETTCQLALKEAKEKLKSVVSKSSYIEYIIPKILPVVIKVFVNIFKDEDSVKKNIEEKFKEYINNIAPGDSLSIGELNKIGMDENNITYFIVSNVFINEQEMDSIQAIQKLEEKFVFNKIVWEMVNI